MFSSFFASKKWALWAYLGLFLLLFFLYMQTSLNVAINSWYSDFYNVLQKPKIELLDSNTTQKAEEKFENNASLIQEANQKAQENFQKANFINKGALYYYQSLLEYFFNSRAMIEKESYSASDFYALILVFLAIAIPYVLIATINIYFASVYAFKWREAMTFSYLKFWKNKDDNIEGSSQRIQEDTYNFSKIVESLGLSFIRALMTLVAFIPILWTLSENSSFYFLKNIDGLLVYVALLISLGGLIVSWFVGIKLPGLEYNNQKAEAAFRKELVYAEDNRKEYAKNETMIELFTGLKFNYKRLFLHYGYFNIWLILFEQMIVIVPFLIMAPGLFAGAIGLGIVMQINNAFDQVRSSFSVFITNWTTITQLRSIHKRLKEFEKNIEYAKNKNKNHL
ncbi:putative transporter [Campylobacter coli]